MFGLTFEKLLLIGIIAVFLLGPERLPAYTAKFAQFVRSLRDMANGAKSRMRDEMGPEFDDVDWKKLDPRQYDPRRIIREALLDDGPAATSAASAGSTVRPPDRTRPEPAYLQHKAKSAGGPVPVGEPGAAAAAAAAGAGIGLAKSVDTAGSGSASVTGSTSAVGGSSAPSWAAGAADVAGAAPGGASAGVDPDAGATAAARPAATVYDSEAT